MIVETLLSLHRLLPNSSQPLPVLAVMDIKAFERLLGPCMDIMKRNIANYEEQLVNLFGSSTEIEQRSP